MEEDSILIGTVVKPHGVRGEVKVVPHTFDIRRFGLLKEAAFSRGAETKTYQIENARYQKQFVILKLNNVDDMDSAAALKGFDITVPRSSALPLGEDEYYAGDIIGCAAYDIYGTLLGEVADVLETGANDVYVIKKTGGGEFLIPAVKKYIAGVDVAEKKIRVDTGGLE